MISLRLVCLFLITTSPLIADPVDDALVTVRQALIKERALLATQRTATAAKRADYHAQLATLKTTSIELTAETRRLSQSISAKQAEVLTLEEKQQRLKRGLSQSRQLLTEARKDLQSHVQKVDPATTAFSSIDPLITQETSPLHTITNALSPILMNHLRSGSQIAQVPAMILQPDGARVNGTVLRIGGIAHFTTDRETAGILVSTPIEKSFFLHESPLPKAMTAAVKDAQSRKTGIVHLPLDVTGGRGLSRLATTKSFIGFLKSGGPIVIPLMIIAVLAILMVIERTIYLLRVDKNVDQILTSVLPFLETSDFDGALATIGSSRGPVSTIVRSAVEHGRRQSDKLEELLQETILAELPTLERFLSALAVMAAAAPLLGLLGTVSGMIGTFEVISTYGTGNAKLLSGGISEALITTEIGLVVAIPILLAHAWLNRQVRTLVGHMDRAAISLASTMRQHPGGNG